MLAALATIVVCKVLCLHVMRASTHSFCGLHVSYSRQGIKATATLSFAGAEPCSADPARLHAGFEARGFIWGAPLALALQCSFVPLRKPGKLPGKLCPPYGHCLRPMSVSLGMACIAQTQHQG